MFTEYNTKYFLILQAQEILSGNYVLILCVREKLTIFISDGIHVVVVENRIFFHKNVQNMIHYFVKNVKKKHFSHSNKIKWKK